jgi:hypothetical protein
MRRGLDQGFAVAFGLCLAASYGLIGRFVESQSSLPSAAPGFLRVLTVEPRYRWEPTSVDTVLNGEMLYASAAGAFGPGGKIEHRQISGPLPTGLTTVRAATPIASAERVLDLSAGICRVVVLRSGDTVRLTHCLAPVERR